MPTNYFYQRGMQFFMKYNTFFVIICSFAINNLISSSLIMAMSHYGSKAEYGIVYTKTDRHREIDKQTDR